MKNALSLIEPGRFYFLSVQGKAGSSLPLYDSRETGLILTVIRFKGNRAHSYRYTIKLFTGADNFCREKGCPSVCIKRNYSNVPGVRIKKYLLQKSSASILKVAR